MKYVANTDGLIRSVYTMNNEYIILLVIGSKLVHKQAAKDLMGYLERCLSLTVVSMQHEDESDKV